MRIFFLAVLFASCGGSGSQKKVTINGVSEYTIPGITAAGVYDNLTNKGFTVKGNSVNDLQSWMCTYDYGGSQFTVILSGRSYDQVTYISAMVEFINDGKDEEDFIAYIASLPYRGSKPETARDWVKTQNTGSSDTMIGPVHIRVSKTEKVRIISMNADGD